VHAQTIASMPSQIADDSGDALHGFNAFVIHHQQRSRNA